MIKVGLTGNIASGKSTVQKTIEELKIPIIDADKICHELLTFNNDIILAVKEAFLGFDIEENNNLCKKKIANLIYNNPELKKRLENILHPIVKKKIIEFFIDNAGEKISVAVVPLLFEANMEGMFDKIIFVSATEEIRLKRLISRNNISAQEAVKIIKSQWSENEKINRSDFIITNLTDKKSLSTQTKEVLKELLN